MMTITAAPPLLPCWVKLESIRHGRLAGYYVGEVVVAGRSFIRLDIPDSNGYGVPQLLAPWLIGRIIPTTEVDARAVAQLADVGNPGPRAEIQGLWPTDEPEGAVFGAGEHQPAPEPPAAMADPYEPEHAEQAQHWSDAMEQAERAQHWAEDAAR